MIGIKWAVILVSLLLASVSYGLFEYTSPLDDLDSEFLVTEGAITGLVSATDGTASWLDNSLSGFIDITATDTITGATLTDGTFSVSGGIISAGTWQGSTIVVSYGGTGATTLTDGGILLGSGTSAVTALAVASNGQIPIGDGATDPVLATITGGSGIDVTNGAGTITLGLGDLTGDWTISANSVTLTGGTLTAEQLTSTDDLNVTGTGYFSDGIDLFNGTYHFGIKPTGAILYFTRGAGATKQYNFDGQLVLQAGATLTGALKMNNRAIELAGTITANIIQSVNHIVSDTYVQAEQLTSTDDLDVTDVGTFGHIQADNFTTDEVTNNTIFVGDDSGGSGTACTNIGEHSGENNTANGQVATGNYSGQNNSGVNQNTYGFSTGQNNTGTYQSAFGHAAGQGNVGNNQVVIGGFTGQNNLGSNQTALGYLAGQHNTEDNQAVIGNSTGQWNTGENMTGGGNFAGRWNGSDNATVFGFNAFNTWTDDTASAKTFDNTAIDDVNDRITITTHGFGATNSYTNLMYDVGTSSIPGLTDGTIYQWKIINANLIELRIGDITDAGSGTGHTFTPKICYANSSAFGYDAEPDAAAQVMLGDTNVTEVKTAGIFKGTGLTLGDNEPIELGEGDGSGGDLGCDGKLYSDGNDLVIQVESPTGASADYTNPSMTIKPFDVFDGAGLYVPVISFPRHGGVGVIDRFLYVRDTSGGTADPSIVLNKGDDVTRFLQLTYNTAGAYGAIRTAVVNDLRLGDADDNVSVAYRLRVGSNVDPNYPLDVTGAAQIGDDVNHVSISATGDIAQAGTGRTHESEKFKLTAIGGYAIRLTNETGFNTIAGQLVKADTATDDAVVLTAASDTECFGVFLDSGVADGSEAWVVVGGIADVAMGNNEAATRGNWVEVHDTEPGYADATGASPAAAPEHFEEIGHCIEGVTEGGVGTHILARCVLHFL